MPKSKLPYVVLVLLMLNLGFFVWLQATVRGKHSAPGTEPERLTQQIRPEALQVLKEEAPPPPAEGETDAAAPAPATPTVCLASDPMDTAQAEAVRQAAASVLPAERWRFDALPPVEEWLVYMGRFPSEDAVKQKSAQLRGLKVTHERAGIADLEPGLILGRHDSEAAAQGALTTLAQRRVRTAKVLKAPEPSPRYSFRMTDVTADMTAELEPLLIALAGKTLHPCSAPERAPVSPPPSPPQTETQAESAR